MCLSLLAILFDPGSYTGSYGSLWGGSFCTKRGGCPKIMKLILTHSQVLERAFAGDRRSSANRFEEWRTCTPVCGVLSEAIGIAGNRSYCAAVVQAETRVARRGSGCCRARMKPGVTMRKRMADLHRFTGAQRGKSIRGQIKVGAKVERFKNILGPCAPFTIVDDDGRGGIFG